MDKVILKKELAKFYVTDASLAELSEKYMPLVIGGTEDKDGYKSVNEGRKTVKYLRIDIENKRKELKEDSLAFGRAVDKEAKRITAKLSEIEVNLSEKQKAIDVEKERILEENRKAKRAVLQSRVDKLQAVGMSIQVHDLVLMSDSDFDALLFSETLVWEIAQKEAKELEDKERTIREVEEIERKRLLAIEQAKLVAERKEAKAMKDKLDAIAKEQADERAALKAEHDKIERNKQDEIKKKIDKERDEEAVVKGKADKLESARAKKGMVTDREKTREYTAKIRSIELPVLKEDKADLDFNNAMFHVKEGLDLLEVI